MKFLHSIDGVNYSLDFFLESTPGFKIDALLCYLNSISKHILQNWILK